MKSKKLPKNIIIYGLLPFLFIAVGVGYAYLNSNLSISGNVMVKKYATTFSEQSWKTIINNVRNNNTSNYHVGDTKMIDLGNFGKHMLRIANMSTPAECSDSNFSQTACGFVLEFVDIINLEDLRASMLPLNTASGGWPSRFLRNDLQETYFSYLPTELQNGIILTKVVSGGRATAEEPETFISTDKLYLLSTTEVYSTVDLEYDAAGSQTRQLDYYQMKGVTSTNYSAAQKEGSNFGWWLRTVIMDRENEFSTVTTDGSNGREQAYYKYSPSYGVSPAFRIG